MTLDFFLNGDPGNVSNRGWPGSSPGAVVRFGSGATTLADQVIASRGTPVEKRTGVRVEVDGVFRDEWVDRM